MICMSCFTTCNRRIILNKNHVISHKRGKDGIMLTTSGTYPWLFVLTGVVFFFHLNLCKWRWFCSNLIFLCSILSSMVCLFALFLFAIISLFDLWLLITTLAYSNALFMYDVMQIYTLLFSTKTKYGINKTCTINLYQGIPNYILNHM
jgi:hypothetical protein